MLSRNFAVEMDEMGGTGYQPVLGGNLPPSPARIQGPPDVKAFGRNACGLVAHRNGQVARSTHPS